MGKCVGAGGMKQNSGDGADYHFVRPTQIPQNPQIRRIPQKSAAAWPTVVVTWPKDDENIDAGLGDTYESELSKCAKVMEKPFTAGDPKTVFEKWSENFKTGDERVDIVIHVSHGFVYERGKGRSKLDVLSQYEDVPKDLQAFGKIDTAKVWLPPRNKAGSFESVLRLRAAEKDTFFRINSDIILEYESGPKLLFIAGACRAMAEPSLANAFHANGTAFVIGFRLATAPGAVATAAKYLVQDIAEAGPSVTCASVIEYFIKRFWTRCSQDAPVLSIRKDLWVDLEGVITSAIEEAGSLPNLPKTVDSTVLNAFHPPATGVLDFLKLSIVKQT